MRMIKSIIIVTALCASVVCHAQWTVTNVHPAGASHSSVFATASGQHAGFAQFGQNEIAGMWSGSGATWVRLHPAGANHSRAFATSGAQQAGFATIGGVTQAGIWSGSAASWVSLHPAGASTSVAVATTGEQQAGRASFGGDWRAGVWSGSAASWVNLNPAGASRSEAFATTGAQQAGYAITGGVTRAGIWSGSALSWVSLHPAEATASVAVATTGEQQAGYAWFGGVPRAGIWSGSAASWVNLNPGRATESVAWATSGALQAGRAIIGGVTIPGVWSGSAASWEPLPLPLDGSLHQANAFAIWSDQTGIIAAGSGSNNVTGRPMALLWTRPHRVMGVAQLEGFVATTDRKPLEVQVIRNGLLVQSLSANYGPNGAFGVSPRFTGPMTLRFRFHTGLWRAVNVDLGATPITGLNVNMVNGDSNRDNAVDLTDIDSVIGFYGAAHGSPGFNAFADLDGDGDVDLTDIDIAIANYLREGD